MNKLFESSAKVSTIGALNANVIWHEAPFIPYAQISLNVNFKEYSETAIISKKIFPTGITK